MTCKICSSPSSQYLVAEVLGKYQVAYYKCTACQFIQTEEPYWLEEAYSSAITKLDLGLVMRNELMTPVVKAVINKWSNPNGKFVDYGGGYGMLVRMMRDRGYDYYRQDTYCANLYAESFDIADLPPFKADLLSAFEVFEHLVDPASELEKMLALSDSVLFSTMVQTSDNVTPETWWYFTPETGQHIALYSRASLEALAKRFKLNYCWNEQDIHLFTRKPISNNLFKTVTHPRWGRWYNRFVGERESLLQRDFLNAQKNLRDSFLKSSTLKK